jgi:hypothetical protein
MWEHQKRLQTLEDLRNYVAETLGRLETLEPRQHPLTHQVLYRSGKPCGVQFCLHGPRAVQLTAIWETERNTIFFYGSQGECVKRTNVLAAPEVVRGLIA